MPGFVLGARSRANLVGVRGDLVRVVKRGIILTPYDFGVVEGVRGDARQRELVAKGFSQTLHSKHLIQADGYGHAVDLVAMGDLDGDGDIDAQDKALEWDPVIYTAIADAMKQAAEDEHVAIRWGGDFKMRDGRPFFDGPHFELCNGGSGS